MEMVLYVLLAHHDSLPVVTVSAFPNIGSVMAMMTVKTAAMKKEAFVVSVIYYMFVHVICICIFLIVKQTFMTAAFNSVKTLFLCKEY